jgi:putative restriction endonuclease
MSRTNPIALPRRNWSREETMMAFALYCILEPRECDDKGMDVQRLASALNRSTNSVALKIWNIAAHDANRQARGRVGMTHGSKLDALVWDWYAADSDAFLSQCIELLRDALARAAHIPGPSATDQYSHLETASRMLLGDERTVTTLQRVNQSYFRHSLLQNYHGSCCITGIKLRPLLLASHIKPWKASTPVEKTAASNGLLLNAFHDRAFDQGFITLDDDYRIVVAHGRIEHSEANDKWLYDFEGRRIDLPLINPPSREFLDYHHRHVFLEHAA